MEYRVHTRLSYSRSITCRTPRTRKASIRLTLQRIFSTLLLFGTSRVPLLALVTDSRTALITNCLSGLLFDSPRTIPLEHHLFEQPVLSLPEGPYLNGPLAYSLRSPPRPARCPCIMLTSCLHKGVSKLTLRLSARALLLRYYRPRLITRRDTSDAISITRHHLLSACIRAQH